MGGVTAGEFRTLLDRLLREAEADDRDQIEVRAGDLHRNLGGYPGPSHRMPVCCEVMRGAMRPGDRTLQQPPKGNGASLTISYRLPRGPSAGRAPASIRPSPREAAPREVAGLHAVGFRPVAEWLLESGRIEHRALQGPVPRSCVFVIAVGSEPRYVGKCEGDLGARLEQIGEPGPTQETHKRLNPLIRQALARGDSVSVLARQVPIDELTGRRDALIRELRPAWNSKR